MPSDPMSDERSRFRVQLQQHGASPAMALGMYEELLTLRAVLAAALRERDEYKELLVCAINAVQPNSRPCVSTMCSIEFLRDGPAEVRLARGAIERDRDANREGMARLTRERDEARAAVDAEWADVMPRCHECDAAAERVGDNGYRYCRAHGKGRGPWRVMPWSALVRRASARDGKATAK
jgi:hypothetical protein